MKTYADKQALLDTIEERYAKFRAEFTDIPEEKRELLVEGVDKTPSEMLSYQLGWLNLLLSWDRDEVAGIEVETPAPGYKWNNLFMSSMVNKAFKTNLLRLICWSRSCVLGSRRYHNRSFSMQAFGGGLRPRRNGRCGSGFTSIVLRRLQIFDRKFVNGKN